MNKLFKLFIVLIVFCSFLVDVNAVDSKKLVAVNESISVKTDTFSYNDISFVYDPINNSSVFNFGSIVNNTDKSRHVSIDILLFDKNKKNIGFLTYCSKSDISSSFSQFKLKSNESSAFKIDVVDKYFVEGYKISDLSYYYVLDENVYCHVGGYSKYGGLTLEEINGGEISSKKSIVSMEFFNYFNKLNLKLLFSIILILIISYGVTGILLNELNKKMNASSTPIVYLPIGNNYMAVKLAFGKMIGTIYLLLLLLSIVLSVVGISFVLYILVFISSVSLVIDIIKLITKKYGLFVFEHSIVSNDSYVNTIKNNANSVNNNSSANETTEHHSFINSNNDNAENNNNLNIDNSTTEHRNFINTDISEEKAVDINYGDNGVSLNEKDNQNSEGSDLTNLFR